MVTYRDTIHTLELEAYRACLRALAPSPLDWGRESLLSNLRKEFGIETATHDELLNEALNDPEIVLLKDARRDGRLDHTFNNPYRRVKRKADDGLLPEMHVSEPAHLGGGPRGPPPMLARGPKPLALPAAPPPPPSAGLSGDMKRGPGRPRVTMPGGAAGAQGAPRFKVGGGKKAVQGLMRQSSIMSDATASVIGPLPSAHLPEVNQYIGWSIERFWPQEANGPWVPGVITDYKRNSDEHCIVYNFNQEDESYEWFRLQDHVEGKHYRLGGMTQILADAVQAQAGGLAGGRGGGGGGGLQRGRGGRGRGGRGRPGSAGTVSHLVFVPQHMPCSDETFQHLLRQPLEEADINTLLQRLHARQDQIAAEMEILAQLQDDDLDEARQRELINKALSLEQAAIHAEMKDLDAEENILTYR